MGALQEERHCAICVDTTTQHKERQGLGSEDETEGFGDLQIFFQSHITEGVGIFC